MRIRSQRYIMMYGVASLEWVELHTKESHDYHKTLLEPLEISIMSNSLLADTSLF